MLLASLTPA